MSEQAQEQEKEKGKKRSKKYKRVREKFEELPLEEKATFLVEAVFTTLTKGIEHAGKAFSEELNSLFEQAREQAERHAESTEDDSGPGEGAPGEADAANDEPPEASGEHADDEPAEEKN